MFKTVTFMFHMLIISTNACIGKVKFRAVIREFFAKKQSHTPFLNLKYFTQFMIRDTTPAANTVREVGHKQSIINFFILSVWDKWLYSFNCHYATDKFGF